MCRTARLHSSARFTDGLGPTQPRLVTVTNPSGLPKFSVLYLTEATLVEAISNETGADPGQIRFFNALGSAPEIPAGRWLIIPIYGG